MEHDTHPTDDPYEARNRLIIATNLAFFALQELLAATQAWNIHGREAASTITPGQFMMLDRVIELNTAVGDQLGHIYQERASGPPP